MKRVDKRAQFYLIAAIVIIAIIIGFVTIQNYSQRPTTKIYDLSEELGIESDQVIEYGIINSKTMETLITNFTEDYAEYIQGDIDKLFFIFGNFEEGIKIINYEEIVQGGISIGGTTINIEDERAISTTIPKEDYESGLLVIEMISLEGEITKHEFNLKPGENFYYIMQSKEGEEQYIVS